MSWMSRRPVKKSLEQCCGLSESVNFYEFDQRMIKHFIALITLENGPFCEKAKKNVGHFVCFEE